MTMITAGELARMRTVANRSLAGTAVIQRATEVGDGQGGYTQTWAASGTVACNVAPVTRRSADEAAVGDRLLANPWWLLTTPALTDIAHRDRVVVAGGTFEVVSMREPRSVEIVRRSIIAQIT